MCGENPANTPPEDQPPAAPNLTSEDVKQGEGPCAKLFIQRYVYIVNIIIKQHTESRVTTCRGIRIRILKDAF
jgi:hypothetical protein